MADGYDTQAMGILGLNAALGAAAVGGDRLLGHQWWIALVGLLVSGLLAGSALFRRVENVGLNLTANLARADRASRDEVDRGIAVALSEAITENAPVLRKKSDRVGVGMLLLIATIIGSIGGVLAF